MQSLLQEEQGRNADMNKALDSMRAQLEGLGKAQQDQAMSLSTSAGKLDDLDQKLEQSLQKVEDVRSDIEHKGERMENLLDLIDTVKRDLNDDSKEIAELKEETARLNGLVKTPSDETPWWDQLADWRYLPATATLLGVIAILVASSKP
jgi:chromosome segregation ATPase